MAFVVNNNWARGEIDPKFSDQVDADFYAQSAEILTNFLANNAGGLSSRQRLQQLITLGTMEPRVALRTWKFKQFEMVVSFSVSFAAPTSEIIVRILDIPSGQLEQFTIPDITIPDADVAVINLGMDSFISTTAVGPTLFVASHWFRPISYTLDNDSLPLSITQNLDIDFYQGLFGTIQSPEPGGNTWTGIDSLIVDQLSPGDTIIFRGEIYTVATVIPPPTPEDDEQFTTVEAYTGAGVIRDKAGVLDTTIFDPADSNQWPKLVIFYAGRLCLFNTINQPTTMWASTTNQPFIIGAAGVDDDDPINNDYATEGLSAFINVAVGSRLFLASDRGEFALGISTEGLTPSTSAIDVIGSTGTSEVPMVTTGDIFYFTNAQRSQVLATQFDFNRQAFTTNNISVLSSHLFEAPIISLTLLQPTSDDAISRLAIVTADNRMVIIGLDANNNIVSFSRFSDSARASEGGEPRISVFSVTADRSYLYLGHWVQENIPGNPELLLSAYGDRRVLGFNANYIVTGGSPAGRDIARYKAVDFAYNSVIPNNGIIQFSIIHPQTGGVTQALVPNPGGSPVAVFVGNVLLDFFLATRDGAEVTVDITGLPSWQGYINENCVVGSPYISELILLPAALSDNEGNILSRDRRVVRTIVSVQDTLLLYVNDQQIIGGAAQPTGITLEPKTDIFTHRILGWSKRDRTRISTPPGYTATIRSISREVK